MTSRESVNSLAARGITSRERVERALAAIAAPAGEGARAFLAVHREAALASADRIDADCKRGATLPALAGVPISIKDNFDEAGRVTRAGSTVLAKEPAASRDAVAVERLRAAGAVIIGRTNMTEFAYSELGINPHYGTPRNIFDRAAARIPGGSSSGAAISVADSMAAAAIGTDTGGSVRIPAALNGLVGFKPTARRVPLEGVLPLSLSLDSAGPIAPSVQDCALIDSVLSADSIELPALTAGGLKFAVPQTVVLEDLAPAVSSAFSAALTRLSAAGACITELPLREFARVPEVNPRGAISSVEAWWWHRRRIETDADQYDPRVLMRIRRDTDFSAADYIQLLENRKRFVRDVESALDGFDALLMPTTPDTAPTIAEVTANDDAYIRFNTRMLRNSSLINLVDGCALSIPCHTGGAPVGLTIAGTALRDHRVLAIGHAVERIVRGT